MTLAETPGRARPPSSGPETDTGTGPETGTAPATPADPDTGTDPRTSPDTGTTANPRTEPPTPPTSTLARHWETLRTAAAPTTATPAAPAQELPPLDDTLREFLAVGEVTAARLPDHRSVRLHLLDLRGNPATRTAATFGALLTVARAARHARVTGEPVVLVAPSSGNGATALRDAVLRAHTCGLAGPDEVRAVCLVPARARRKVWDSALAADPELRRRNPVVIHHGSDPSTVTELAEHWTRSRGSALGRERGYAVWYVPDLDDDRTAGALRALAEGESLPPAPPAGRTHAQAVDTAAGLLGHRDASIRALDGPHTGAGPRYFLVQHAYTPDLVLHLLTGTASRDAVPLYTYDAVRRVHRQHSDPHWPRTTYSPDESVDATFHTRRPPTSAELSALAGTDDSGTDGGGAGGSGTDRGGTDSGGTAGAAGAAGVGGVVVSRYECLARYPSVRAMLRPTGIELPADPDALHEWSLLMTMTGVLNAVDRGLLTGPEVLVHATGSYGAEDRTPLPDAHLRYADAPDELDTLFTRALAPKDPKRPTARPHPAKRPHDRERS